MSDPGAVVGGLLILLSSRCHTQAARAITLQLRNTSDNFFLIINNTLGHLNLSGFKAIDISIYFNPHRVPNIAPQPIGA